MFIDNGEPHDSPYPRMPYQQDYDTVRRINEELQFLIDSGSLDNFDGKILNKIIKPDPEYEPSGELFERLQTVLSENRQPHNEQLFDIGIDIGARICAQERTVRGQVLSYLNTCVNLDSLKVGMTGAESSTKTELSILSHIRSILIEELPAGPRTDKLFEVIIELLMKAQKQQSYGDESFSWLAIKARTLMQQHQAIHGFKDHVLSFYDRDSTEKQHDRQPDINEVITELNQESMSNRKFGTKPAYIEASVGGSWVFYDGDDFRNIMLKGTKNITVPQFAAIVLHSPHKVLQNLRIDTNVVWHGAYTSTVELAGNFAKIDPTFAVVIGLDGIMSVDFEGLMTVDKLLHDRPEISQALKAEVASNFYDLSMPVYDNASLGHRNYLTFPDEDRRNFDPIKQLLIPRLRRQTPPVIESVDITREVHEQDVSWFVRRLPNGWRASPEATEEAARLNIALEPNETFVRAHKRNIGAQKRVLGYHAVKRM